MDAGCSPLGYLGVLYTCYFVFFFFFNDTATTEIYTLSLHDALPISARPDHELPAHRRDEPEVRGRSEEHTSELQSPYVISYAVFCLKKKTNKNKDTSDFSYARSHARVYGADRI